MANSLGNKIDAYGELAEIKRIYSAIEAALLKKNSACLLITSGARGEGKTTIAKEIAAYASRQNGKRILVMDMNWYAPSVHEGFNIDRFFEYESLRNGAPISDFVKTSELENLDVFPAIKTLPGLETPFSDIDTVAVNLIKKAREKYAFIIVDAAAMFPTNRRMIDPTIVSKEADGVAIVALANATPRENVKKAMKTLEAAGANIIGVVANHWRNPMA